MTVTGYADIDIPVYLIGGNALGGTIPAPPRQAINQHLPITGTISWGMSWTGFDNTHPMYFELCAKGAITTDSAEIVIEKLHTKTNDGFKHYRVKTTSPSGQVILQGDLVTNCSDLPALPVQLSAVRSNLAPFQLDMSYKTLHQGIVLLFDFSSQKQRNPEYASNHTIPLSPGSVPNTEQPFLATYGGFGGGGNNDDKKRWYSMPDESFLDIDILPFYNNEGVVGFTVSLTDTDGSVTKIYLGHQDVKWLIDNHRKSDNEFSDAIKDYFAHTLYLNTTGRPSFKVYVMQLLRNIYRASDMAVIYELFTTIQNSALWINVKGEVLDITGMGGATSSRGKGAAGGQSESGKSGRPDPGGSERAGQASNGRGVTRPDDNNGQRDGSNGSGGRQPNDKKQNKDNLPVKKEILKNHRKRKRPDDNVAAFYGKKIKLAQPIKTTEPGPSSVVKIEPLSPEIRIKREQAERREPSLLQSGELFFIPTDVLAYHNKLMFEQGGEFVSNGLHWFLRIYYKDMGVAWNDIYTKDMPENFFSTLTWSLMVMISFALEDSKGASDDFELILNKYDPFLPDLAFFAFRHLFGHYQTNEQFIYKDRRLVELFMDYHSFKNGIPSKWREWLLLREARSPNVAGDAQSISPILREKINSSWDTVKDNISEEWEAIAEKYKITKQDIKNDDYDISFLRSETIWLFIYDIYNKSIKSLDDDNSDHNLSAIVRHDPIMENIIKEVLAFIFKTPNEYFNEADMRKAEALIDFAMIADGKQCRWWEVFSMSQNTQIPPKASQSDSSGSNTIEGMHQLPNMQSAAQALISLLALSNQRTSTNRDSNICPMDPFPNYLNNKMSQAVINKEAVISRAGNKAAEARNRNAEIAQTRLCELAKLVGVSLAFNNDRHQYDITIKARDNDRIGQLTQGEVFCLLSKRLEEHNVSDLSSEEVQRVYSQNFKLTDVIKAAGINYIERSVNGGYFHSVCIDQNGKEQTLNDHENDNECGQLKFKRKSIKKYEVLGLINDKIKHELR